MVNPRKALAARLENDLANRLWELGFAVVRGPSSGSGARRRFQPDLVAIRGGVVVVIEVKRARRGRPLYLRREQVEGLREFARRAGGLAVVAAHIPGVGWRFHMIDGLEETASGNLKIARPEAGHRMEAFLELLFPRSRRMDEFL